MPFLQVGNNQFYEVLEKVSGQKDIDDWAKLQRLMEPLAKAATAVPPIAIRADPGVALTAIARYLPRLFSGGPDALKLIGPFSKVRQCSELPHSLLLQLIRVALVTCASCLWVQTALDFCLLVCSDHFKEYKMQGHMFALSLFVVRSACSGECDPQRSKLSLSLFVMSQIILKNVKCKGTSPCIHCFMQSLHVM